MVVEVQAYSGYKARERPQRFRLGDQWREVREVTDRWYSPGATYFKILAEDESLYVLRLDEETDQWTLEAFTAPSRSKAC